MSVPFKGIKAKTIVIKGQETKQQPLYNKKETATGLTWPPVEHKNLYDFWVSSFWIVLMADALAPVIGGGAVVFYG